MRISTTLIMALLALGAMLFSPLALGATRTASLSPEIQARHHYQDGEEHYRHGRFAQALEAFAEAYQDKALPTLLFNMGQCHMELENFGEAIVFFEGYLRDKPQAKNRALAEERVREARLALSMRTIPSQGHATAATTQPPAPFYRQQWFWGVVAGSVAAAAGTAAVLHWQYGGEARPPAGSLGTADRR